jgi:adhesin transport system membrane fusion protein
MGYKNLHLINMKIRQSLKNSNLFSHFILWTVMGCLVIGLIWAKLAVIDEMTRGQGKVIPSSQVQVIQNLEGGVVKSINIKEGAIVKKGQVLMVIENTLFTSKVNDLQKKIDDVSIELIRLNAEMTNTPLVFDAATLKNNPDLVKLETAFYESRKIERKQMQDAIDLAQKEIDMTKPLVSKGAVSPVEVLRLERTLNDLEGKLYSYNSKTLERMNAAKGELDSYQEQILAEQDRLTRTVVRSPVNGIIKQLKINTVGGVITPGMDVLYIVPMNDTLLIEAKIRPQDIGFIHVDQKAMVKLSAFDYTIYGELEGKVEQISADTIIDENDKKGESYYVIHVRTQKNYLGTKEKPLYIIPGMQATVDILTGRKSVLDYLLKPILKAKQSALRER